MEDAYETYDLAHGRKLEIHYDRDPLNPREEWDQMTTMFSAHDRYRLGEKLDSGIEGLIQAVASVTSIELPAREELLKIGERLYDCYDKEKYSGLRALAWKEIEEIAFVKPLYIYDHSGITISTKPFSCRWDSGQYGWIVLPKEVYAKNFPTFRGRWTKKQLEAADKVIEAEVEVFDQYLRGDVYGFRVLDKEGEEEDSCWGFYGDDIRENGILDHIDHKDVRYLYRTKQIRRKQKGK